MKKIKIVTVLGTRPEIIRLSETIKKLNNYFNHKLVFTNQNYSKELSDFFFNNFKIKFDYNLNIDNKSPIKSISQILLKFDKVLNIEKPDACLILGDTNSALSMIAAKKKNIPIFHYEAGNRCFDERVPEEINRKIIDHIADINLTYSNSAKQNLIDEGLPLKNIFNIGSPLMEVYISNKKKIEKSIILKKFGIKENEYFLVSLHREENLNNIKNFKTIIELLNKIATKYKKKLIFSTHPRTFKVLKSKKIKTHKNIIFSKPLNYFDYCKLQIKSLLTLSDSGSISEEAYIMKFKALNLRETHERHEAMEKTIAPMMNFKLNSNIEIISKLLNEEVHYSYLEEYEQKDISHRVVKIIHSYIDYINTFKYLK